VGAGAALKIVRAEKDRQLTSMVPASLRVKRQKAPSLKASKPGFFGQAMEAPANLQPDAKEPAPAARSLLRSSR